MPLNVNPMQLLSMIRSGKNPQQLVIEILSDRAGNDPMAANMLSMINSGNQRGIEQVARNYFQSQGRDFDKEFKKKRKILGL